MPKFLKVIINPRNAHLQNISYIPDILNLVKKYKNKLFDDYFFEENPNLSQNLIALIKKTSPYFWVVADNNGNFGGFAYLDDWQGCSKVSHSATITTCITPKYRGKFTLCAGKKLIRYVFKKFKLTKLKAEVYSTNKNAISLLKKLGFKKECTLIAETLVNKELTDIDIYSIIKN